MTEKRSPGKLKLMIAYNPSTARKCILCIPSKQYNINNKRTNTSSI